MYPTQAYAPAGPAMYPIQSPIIIAPFNDKDEKYKCCCDSMHSKTAVLVVIVIESLLTAFGLIGGIYRLTLSTDHWWYAVSAIVSVIVLGNLIYGYQKEHAGYLVPYLTLSVVSMAGAVILIGLSFVAALNMDAEYGTDAQYDTILIVRSAQHLLIGVIVALGVYFAAMVAFIIAVVRCRRYFMDKQIFGGGQVQYAQNMDLGAVNQP